MIQDLVAVLCLGWYIFILCVCAIGIYQIRYYHLHPLPLSPSEIASQGSESWLPHITVIRPAKGVEPYLYDCLASTFHQTYPTTRLTVYFCISSRDDPALHVIERLLANFPAFDARLYVEEEDPNLSGDGGTTTSLGPNPKIRNMSRAYREAKGDIVWIVDCNVWVGPSTANRMVDALCGFSLNPRDPYRKKYMFVHQLPLAVDLSSTSSTTSIWSTSGGLLEETFLSTAHAKFYTAINTVAIAPCIVGKSNMFRRSHLNALTSSPSAINPSPNPPQGIDYFSSNICEDHLIGDLLWKSPVPAAITALAAKEGQFSPPHPTTTTPTKYLPAEPSPPTEIIWGKHAMLPPTTSPRHNTLAIQPTQTYPLRTYIDRRTRWLRVRKFTVTLATLIEPGTESLLCSAYASYAFTTLPWFHTALGVPQTWAAFWAIWFAHVGLWAAVDWWVWGMLQGARGDSELVSGGSDGHDHDDGNSRVGGGEVPPFAKHRAEARSWWRWTLAWLGREALAFPIWAWAVLGGGRVVWRGRAFWVGVDMRVREISGSGGRRWRSRSGLDDANGESSGNGNGSGSGSGGESGGRKRRRD